MNKHVKEYTDNNFELEVKKSDEVVLVDFWAPWCGPCKMMSPVIDELAEAFKDEKVSIGKVNVDENATVASEFQIRSIPTLVVFKGGKPVDTIVGLNDKATLESKLKQHM